MCGPRVYESASDVYTWQNNFLNNSETKVGGGCEFHAYTSANSDVYTLGKNYVNNS